MSGVETTCFGLAPMWTSFRGRNSVKLAPDMESSSHDANAKRSTTVIGASFGMSVPRIRTAVSREHV